MKERKNIERLFQEKFKDFEVSPPIGAWDKINSRLEKDTDKKIFLPLWFKWVGIAASLFLLLGVAFYLINTEKNKIEDVNTKMNTIESTVVDSKNKDSILIQDGQTLVLEEPAYKDKVLEKNILEGNQNKFDRENTTSSPNKLIEVISDYPHEPSGLWVETEKKSIKKEGINSSVKNHKIEIVNNEYIVEAKNEKDFSTEKDDSELVSSLEENQNQNGKIVKKSKNNILGLEERKNEVVDAKSKKNNERQVEFSDHLKKNTTIENNILLDKDSTIVVVENKTDATSLEQLLEKKNEGENADEKEKRNKWVISGNASPVYFNSISNGSPIDEQFKNNEKEFATSFSYGVGLEYSISERVNVRTGLNAINLSYNTESIYYTNSLNEGYSNTLNIELNDNSKTLEISNNEGVNNSFSQYGEVYGVKSYNQASLKQEMGFIEVPMELTYKIIDKKFGIDLIGGMSTLFLSKNSISIISENSEMSIGKASNLNDIHFSSNVGLGFKYSFGNSINLNLQPVFKYQINTFKENSGDFKPYFIGVYSGLSYQF